MVLARNPKRAKELKIKADQAFVQGKWKKSLEYFKDLSEEIPDDTRVLQRVADLSKRLGDSENAIASYKKLAKLLAHQGFWAKAMAVNKMILELDPRDLEVQRQLAKLCAGQSDFKADSKADPKEIPFAQLVDERAAISLAGEQPRSMDQLPDSHMDALMGATVSISEGEPKKITDEATTPEATLGKPCAGLKGIPLFSEMSVDEVSAVVDRLSMKKFPQDSLLCEEGDLGNSMYIIAEGLAEVFTKKPDGSKLVLGKLRGGEFFGEYGLLTNGTRNASVQALTEVEVLEITMGDVDSIVAKHPRIWVILEEHVRRRMLFNILAKSPVFQVLAPEEKYKLVGFLNNKKAKPGDVVTPQDTDGDEMFFIRAGSLIVTVEKEGGQKILVGELSAGDYFGEVAMLTGKRRTATVTAKTDCELLRLGRKEAAQVLKGNREVLVRLQKRMDERKKETHEAFQSYLEAKTTLGLV